MIPEKFKSTQREIEKNKITLLDCLQYFKLKSISDIERLEKSGDWIALEYFKSDPEILDSFMATLISEGFEAEKRVQEKIPHHRSTIIEWKW